MNKEKIISLTKYLGRLEERAAAPVTSKWAKSPRTYKEFIAREIAVVKAKLEAARLAGDNKK